MVSHGTVNIPNYEFTIFDSQYVMNSIQGHVASKSQRYMMDDHLIQVFSMAYCLMTRKMANVYVAVYQFIEDNLLKIETAEIMSDYEDGRRLTLQKHWPNVVIRGCWFHLKRAEHLRLKR